MQNPHTLKKMTSRLIKKIKEKGERENEKGKQSIKIRLYEK